MRRIIQYLAKIISAKVVFLSLGIASTIWFLLRVLPKPSRAGYPCMRAAAPFASAFVLYLISISASVVFFRKFKRKLLRREYYSAFGLIAITAVLVYFAGSGFNQEVNAIEIVTKNSITPNDPIGVPKGLAPGRVVWVWDKDATDKSCTNSNGNWWFDNTDKAVVDSMMHKGIQSYAGMENTTDAWDAIFKHFNSSHGKGEVGYVAGEKVYVKINVTNSCCSVNGTKKYKDFERMDATPEVVLALLKQLVEVVGIAQSDIYLGDPFRTFHDLYWDMCQSVYPNVNYCDGQGLNGRHQTVPTLTDIVKFSDGLHDWRLPQEYVDAEYFINLPCLKSHDSGGITLAAKNHQGSVLQDGAASTGQLAYDMHYALPDHDATDGGHYRYRHLVDYMGHEHLGGKTLLVIIDGIWAGKSWQGYVEKWQMKPFEGDYPNSLFFAQDLLAVESVCWDFLLEEYANKPSNEKYPYMEGAGDYLYQAADPANWPAGVSYDPEGDGSALGSLGVFEHWNNGTEMNYTVIDFVKVLVERETDPEPEIVNHKKGNSLNVYAYPNPTSDHLYIDYTLSIPSEIHMELYDLQGKKIELMHQEHEYTGSHQVIYNVDHLSPGFYLIKIQTHNGVNIDYMVKKIQVI